MHTIDLIRHAESEWVVTADNSPIPLFGGQMNDVDLSETGQDQAARLGEYAREHGIKPLGYFSSPAKRALRTHQLSGLPGVPTVDDRLAERDWGQWTGQPRALRNQSPYREQLLELGNDFAPPGGESVNQVLARSQAFLRDLVANYPPGHYWVHTHRNLIKALVGNYLGWTTEQISESGLFVVSITRFEAVDSDLKLVMFNQPTI